MTWAEYGQDLETNLQDLHARVQQGRYRAKPSRRVYIPKPDGRKRPLGIASLEDKIVQRAVAEVLNAVYEVDFRGFSYGFRPGRSPHDALDALSVGITTRRVNWVLDADIRDFFGQLDRAWLRRFLEHRIADPRILRLIDKWLAAGVVEDGVWTECERGSPQGASVSPLLANIYLHYVLDWWADWWRRQPGHGDMIIVRCADDFIVGFEDEQDARVFLTELRERFARFGLELHPDKTRLIEFGRNVGWKRTKRGLGKPETFDFLGFTHICAKSKRGRFWVKRITIAKRIRAKLREIKIELKRRRHHPVPEQGAWLRSVVARTHRLLRRARQHRRGSSIPHPGRQTLVQGAAAPQPTLTPELETDGPTYSTMAPTSPRDAPVPIRAPGRQNLRQEPSAVVPHAGI